MEAVAADTVAAVELQRDCVEIGLLGEGLVKCRVEDGYVRDVTEELLAGLDAAIVGRIVQGRKGEAVADCLLDVIINEHRLGDLLSAVDDAVADGVYDPLAFRRRELSLAHVLRHDAESVAVIFDGDLAVGLLSGVS